MREEIARDRQTNTRRAPAQVVETPETVDAGLVGQMIFDSRNAGRAEAHNEAALRAAQEAQLRAGNQAASQAFESVVSWDKPLVTAVGELVTQGYRAQADVLLNSLAGHEDHYVEAWELQEALAERDFAESIEADATVELARLAAETEEQARADAARQAADHRFLSRNPRANMDLLREAKEEAWVMQGEDLSLAEAADRVRVAAAGYENHRLRESIQREGWKSSQTLQKQFPSGPPAPDHEVSFRSAAKVVSLTEGERIKQSLLEPELGSEAQSEMDELKRGAPDRLAAYEAEAKSARRLGGSPRVA
jgi:hypothetical protein